MNSIKNDLMCSFVWETRNWIENDNLILRWSAFLATELTIILCIFFENINWKKDFFENSKKRTLLKW